MKKLIILCLMAVALCILGLSCEKGGGADALPAATTNGASTMGFLIDGKEWVAQSNDFKISKTQALYEASSGLIYIYGVNHPIARLEMRFKNPKIGLHHFTTEDNIKYITYDNSPPYNLDIADASNNFKITRYDGNVIAGEFTFKLKSADGTTVSITSGRFDIPVK